MSGQVLLLRGVNVGGHGKLPMAALRELAQGIGAGRARSWIQSGNLVVDLPIDPAALAGRIEAEFGFRPAVLAIGAEDWRRRLADRPLPGDPAALHLWFGDDLSLPDLAPLQALAAPDEELAATPGVIWLRAPRGIGRSKLAAAMERTTGRSLTARNWRTVTALTALLDDPG